ncbi:MAG: tetratricopeptide repeat protein [Kiritimatiellaceae bacterium]|nr:tetratricopeptide repeat protein [Kiritimatiellaceae bacterium]
MQKKKDEIRDIYQGGEHDLEKDFTPQIARERLEERHRDLRRSQLVSLFFGSLVIVLSVSLVAVVIRNFLSERSPSKKNQTKESVFVPRYTLPTEALWVMDYQAVSSQLDNDEKTGPKPLSTKWVKNAAYHIIMGQQALAMNELKQALEHFQKVVAAYPDIEGLHGSMGQLYLQSQEYALAAQHLEKALKEEETFDTVNNLGTAYIGTEEYDKAEKNLKKALGLKPEAAGTHKNLASLYRKMKRDNEAVFHFEKYIDLQPGDLDTMQTYALYLTKLGRWKDAADFLTKLTQNVTDVAPIYFLLAQVQVQNGQPDKAIAALKRGVQLIDPQLALAWMSREEFNVVRSSGDFKTLVDQLEIANVSLDKKR